MPSPASCHFKVWGNGPPLVLIHGVGSTLENWNPIAEILGAAFECICYDLRGHGRSPRPPTPYSLDMLVADLEALRRDLNLESMHIAGHSLGGMIGPAYALKYPDRVLSLGLLSTAAGRTAQEKAAVLRLVEQLEKSGAEPLIDTLIDRWFTPGFASARPDVVEARKKQVLANDSAVFASVFRIYATTEMEHFLHHIEAPALVMTGENDTGCNPRINRFIGGRMPNSELRILPELRHSILLEAPEAVAANLSSFLSNHA